uniref:Putative secreted protein n=1 Tax=Anopheles darlingi TaxID=43151 RepID=A0A2M4DHW3_ANODA
MQHIFDGWIAHLFRFAVLNLDQLGGTIGLVEGIGHYETDWLTVIECFLASKNLLIVRSHESLEVHEVVLSRDIFRRVECYYTWKFHSIR